MAIGKVYVLKNQAMPGLVKIGKTSQDSVEFRMSQLYSSGVPLPFECVYAAEVEDMDKVESALHIAFSPQRMNPRREFFSIEPYQAIAILKLLEKKEITDEVKKNIDIEAVKDFQDSQEQIRSRGPNLNFIEMSIPIGSILTFVNGGETAEIISENKVKYNNEEVSLSKLTKDLLKINYNIRPNKFWLFKGRSLSSIYNETYEIPE